MSAVVLHRIDPAKNMARYYRLDMQPDLFGGFNVTKEWGRIGRGGQVRQVFCSTESDALGAVETQHKAKVRRGYVRLTQDGS